MTAPATWGITLSGTAYTIEGEPRRSQGINKDRLLIAPRFPASKDSQHEVTIIGTVVPVPLAWDGTYTVTVPHTDDPDLNPTNFTYRVEEDWPGGRTFDIALPRSLGSAVNMIDVAPVEVAEGISITKGDKGDPGPEGPQGIQGAPGGSDAATAGWIEGGPLTSAALSATIETEVGPLVGDLVPPLVPPLVADAIAEDGTIRAAAVAAMDDAAVQAQLAFAKGALANGTDLHALASGQWFVASYSAANSLINKPPAAALGAAQIHVLGGAVRVIMWHATTSLARTRTWTKNLDSTGNWSDWFELNLEPAKSTAITTAVDVLTLALGTYYVQTGGTAAGIINAPAISANPAVIEVLGNASGVRSVLWHPATAVPGALPATWKRHRDNGGVWSGWYRVGYPVQLLPTTDIHATPPGTYWVQTSGQSTAVINRPPLPIDTAVVEIVGGTGGGDVRTITWRSTPAAASGLKPLVAQKHRDNGGNWSEWYDLDTTGAVAIHVGAQAGSAALRYAALAVRAAQMASPLPLETWRWTAPPAAALTFPTHEGSGQAVHPSVLYYPAGKFGHKYWMAMTPYPAFAEAHEDPNVIVSDDGTAWSVPAGTVNPLDDQPGAPGNHNSDTHLVEDHDGNLLLTWRMVDRADSSRNVFYERRYDGVSWSAKREMRRHNGLLSQSLVRDGSGWLMYGISGTGDLLRSSTTVPAPVTADWAADTTCAVAPTLASDRKLWHGDVQKVGSEWWAIFSDCLKTTSGGGYGDLYLARSTDGLDWELAPVPITTRALDVVDSLYKTGFVVSGVGTAAKLDLFPSGYSVKTSRWSILRTTAIPM